MQNLLILPLIFITALVSGQVKKAEIVKLNVGNIYYETYGKGEPLFFLHGSARTRGVLGASWDEQLMRVT